MIVTLLQPGEKPVKTRAPGYRIFGANSAFLRKARYCAETRENLVTLDGMNETMTKAVYFVLSLGAA